MNMRRGPDRCVWLEIAMISGSFVLMAAQFSYALCPYRVGPTIVEWHDIIGGIEIEVVATNTFGEPGNSRPDRFENFSV